MWALFMNGKILILHVGHTKQIFNIVGPKTINKKLYHSPPYAQVNYLLSSSTPICHHVISWNPLNTDMDIQSTYGRVQMAYQTLFQNRRF
jgi:hypothetical protein